MKDAQPQTIYLKDYREPDYWIDQTDLQFELVPENTRVTATLKVRRNEKQGTDLPPLELAGVDLVLEQVKIDGQLISDYELGEESLTLPVSAAEFELEIVNRINPKNNTSLEGLYLSNGMYCTQCEAEGFRKITYYLDRPDVMSTFSTRIIADKSYPVLLSNGNDVERGELDDGRHFVCWQDPFPKPAYLFALVAGDLEHVEDHYTTASGRDVNLKIFTEPRNIDKCEHAMRSLKKSMAWDEEVYGREYDLDIFMIVAVDHFNMGAMENKGLNIFNSSCVLARPDTATDATYQRIEAIVAHEYFHNWSGNRVTCRDWFQLSLKEGFTVFRDAEFSADMNSRVVKRIEDATLLRSAQFAEDAGPMSHPVRPDSYMEISNFYTLTVYEKGAEVVRMIHTLLGPEGFRKGSDLYFQRHDGQAVTCDDFVKAMEDANGIDLTQFRHWYSQAGTPVVTVEDDFDVASGTYQLTLSQHCPVTPGQAEKKPLHIPFRVGLLGADGRSLPVDSQGNTSVVLELREARQVFNFTDLNEKPLPSLLQGFSAPVRVNYPYTEAQLAFLMSHDQDGFNRWDAGQRLAVAVILQGAIDYRAGKPLQLDSNLRDAFMAVLDDQKADPAMRAEMLQLPSESYLSEQVDAVDVGALHYARTFIKKALAEQLQDRFMSTYEAYNTAKTYQPDAADIAERTLKNVCLSYLASLQTEPVLALVLKQYHGANNMTDQAAALKLLANEAPKQLLQPVLDEFYQTWHKDNQVLDMWFSVQAASALHTDVVAVMELLGHADFDRVNPNRVRALLGAFCMQNPVRFHSADGSGYNLLAEQIIDLDRKNPQLAARLLTPLTRWRRYVEPQQGLMKEALKQIMAAQPLSRDVYEVVSKSLKD